MIWAELGLVNRLKLHLREAQARYHPFKMSAGVLRTGAPKAEFVRTPKKPFGFPRAKRPNPQRHIGVANM